MTTSLTFCSHWLYAAALVLFASAASGHAIHAHGEQSPSAEAENVLDHYSIDDLMQLYSMRGDDALLEAAEKKLPPLEQLSSIEHLLQAAWLAQANHEFTRALDLLQRVLDRQPNHGQAWLMQAAISTVVGDHAGARHACGYLLLSVSPDAAVVCFATLADTPARKADAYARLSQMPEPPSASRLAAWRWSVQAELAADLGQTDAAEKLFQRAIGIFPAVQTRAALMDFYLEHGRYQAALDLVAPHDSVPALAVRRLLAQQRLGVDIRIAADRMDKRFQHWLKINDYRHAREMAMFYLDIDSQADLAFRAASKNAILQREPEDLALLGRATKLQRLRKDI